MSLWLGFQWFRAHTRLPKVQKDLSQEAELKDLRGVAYLQTIMGDSRWSENGRKRLAKQCTRFEDQAVAKSDDTAQLSELSNTRAFYSVRFTFSSPGPTPAAPNRAAGVEIQVSIP